MTKTECIQNKLLRFLRKRLLEHCSTYICLYEVPHDIEQKFSLIVTSARSKRKFRSLTLFQFEVCVQAVYSVDVLPLLQKVK